MYRYRYTLRALIASSLLLAGCAEVEVSPTHHKHLHNAPVNEGEGIGIVSYSKEAFDIDKERQHAYDAMAESCHGRPYKIIKEDVKRGSGDYLDEDAHLIFGIDSDRVYISYRCLDQGAY